MLKTTSTLLDMIRLTVAGVAVVDDYRNLAITRSRGAEAMRNDRFQALAPLRRSTDLALVAVQEANYLPVEPCEPAYGQIDVLRNT